MKIEFCCPQMTEMFIKGEIVADSDGIFLCTSETKRGENGQVQRNTIRISRCPFCPDSCEVKQKRRK